MHVKTVLPFALVAAIVAACAGGQTEPKSPETSGAAETASAASTETAPAAPAESASAAPASTEAEKAPGPVAGAKKFDDMNDDERKEHMKKVVVPRMAEVFREHDAKEFAKFGCSTCHGPGAKNGDFHMPSASLPKLSVANGFEKHMKKSPAMTKFMMEKVVPAMAETIGEAPFDPKTGKGFGCFECHQKE